MAGKKKTGIGLDIGNKAIRLVVLEQNSKGIDIKTKVTIPNMNGFVRDNEIVNKEEFAKLLKGLLSDNKVLDKGINIALSAGITSENNKKSYVVRTFPQQMLVPSELKRSIKYSIEKELPVDVEEYYTSWDIADTYKESGREVGIVFTIAANKKLVESFVGVLNSIKVPPYVLDMGMLANSRALIDPRNRHDINNNVVVVDVGYAETGVLIISKGRPHYYRAIEIGAKDIIKNIMDNKGLSEVDAESLLLYDGSVITDRNDRNYLQETDPSNLSMVITETVQQIVNEINEIINFVQRKGTISTLQRIYLNGGCSKIRNFDQLLYNELNIQTQYLCPYFLMAENVEYNEEVIKSQLEYNTAIGLALGEVEK